MYRIQDIVKHLDQNNPRDVLSRIVSYYFDDKEKVYFHCFELYQTTNKKQREIGALLHVLQFKVSVRFKALKQKIQIISDFLMYTNFTDLLKNLERDLSVRQFEVFCYLLAGNRQASIARHFKCTPASILCVVRNALKRIRTKTVYSQILSFLNKMKLLGYKQA